jgi:hypothetical protein
MHFHPFVEPQFKPDRLSKLAAERSEANKVFILSFGFNLKSQGFNLYDGFMKPILSLPLKSLPNVFIILDTDRNLNFAANNLAHDV